MCLSDLKKILLETEEQISLAETQSRRLPVPSLNELRYVAVHLLTYEESDDSEIKQRELEKAVNHCKRAYYDAQRFMLLNLYGDVVSIRRGLGAYSHFFASLAGSEYIELKQRVRAADRYLRETQMLKRDNERWEKRHLFYLSCEEHIKACRDYVDLYDNLQDEISDCIQSSEKTKSLSRWGIIIAIIVGVLTLIGLFI